MRVIRHTGAHYRAFTIRLSLPVAFSFSAASLGRDFWLTFRIIHSGLVQFPFGDNRSSMHADGEFFRFSASDKNGSGIEQ